MTDAEIKELASTIAATCTHDIAEGEAANFDGLCPLCLAARVAELESRLRMAYDEADRLRARVAELEARYHSDVDGALDYLVLAFTEDESITAKEVYDFLASIGGDCHRGQRNQCKYGVCDCEADAAHAALRGDGGE